MTQEELQVVPRANIGAALADLPQFKAAESPVTSSANVGAGRFPINIRGLGDKRSLLLLDGRRLVSSDLNTVPSIMIDSVDIVTGGASAAWGSDAVGGVVNLNVDGDYAGIRLGAEAGVSSRGDAQQYKIEGKFGTSFADGRGHLVVGGEFVDNKGIPRRIDRENTGRWSTNGNIALTPNVGYSTRLVGGYINSGVLKGLGFNPDGSLRTPNLGTIIGSSMIGGEAPSNDDIGTLIVPQRRYAVMAKASFELTETLKLSGDVRYSRYYNRYPWFGVHTDNLTISSQNAFLRPEIRSRLAAAGQTSFLLSRFNGDLSFADIDVDRRNIQASIALDGSFGGGRWRYTAFYSHGEYRNDLRTPGFLITQNFNNAVDAVTSPTTGQPVCRVALTNPSSNCVPLNLFGLGAPSQAAIDYVTGTPQSDTLRQARHLWRLAARRAVRAAGGRGFDRYRRGRSSRLDSRDDRRARCRLGVQRLQLQWLLGQDQRQGSLWRNRRAGGQGHTAASQARAERCCPRFGLQPQRHHLVVEVRHHQ